jgi:CDP-6-deoxy-D-xylo-4-hexulose-3-dehydrase
MINLVKDTIDKDDIQSLISWLNQEKIPRLTKGDLTIELEKKWAEKIGSKYSVFVNSGSSAILLSLAVLKEFNLIKNNKLVAPALSWVTDVSSPLLLGFETRLCDCNLTDLSCDLVQLEKIFIEFEPAVFISVAPLGLVPDMEKLIDLCKKYDVLLLEDVCESMGSTYNGKYLGSFGFASVFSTYFGHHLSTIEGGFINTDNEEFYHGLLMMRSHGWDRDLPEFKQKELRKESGVDDFSALYTFFVSGMNLRSTDLQAFIGIRAIDKLDRFSKARNKNFNLYLELVKDNLITINPKSTDFVSNFAFPVVSKNKSDIVVNLKKQNIECRPLIAGNMANKPFWIKKYGKSNEFPNADLIDQLGFYVPNHQDLTEIEIQLVASIINGEYVG